MTFDLNSIPPDEGDGQLLPDLNEEAAHTFDLNEEAAPVFSGGTCMSSAFAFTCISSAFAF